METIINSINEPIIGLNNDMEILFINDEALNVINLKREEVIKHSAQDISLRNDLLRRLIRELVEIPGEPVKDKEKEKKEPLKIYVTIKRVFPSKIHEYFPTGERWGYYGKKRICHYVEEYNRI